ncbi:MAG: CdaR family protein [Vicinamibacteraceae bacterium]
MAYHPFRHLGLKVLSIALAGAIWLTVGDQRAIERTMRVPLEYHNLPGNLELMASPPDTVEVRLRGPSGTIGRLLPGEVVAVLDLTAARPGTRLFHMLADEVRVPYGVGVSQVNPAALPLTFEPSASRSVPVVPVVDGEPAAGYRVGRILSSPEQVTVIGPTSHVASVTSATTEAVSVGNATTTVVDRVVIGVANELVRLNQPQSANVSVEIVPVAEDKRVADVPVATRGLGEGLSSRIEPASVVVVLRGARARLLPLTTATAYVDVTGMAPGRYDLPVKIDPIADVQVAATQPATVAVRIR